MLPLALAVPVGCADRATAVARREAPWWGDVAALEATTGLRLAEVGEADPVGYWPRLVLGTDGASVDDRAWWLALDPKLRDEAWLVERDDLPFGVPPTDRPATLPLVKLALDDVFAALRAADDRGLAPSTWPTLLVVADERLPSRTLVDALYTLSQSAFSSYALGVASGGRVRNVWVDEPGCPTHLTLALGAGGAVLLPEDAPPLLPPGGACPASPEAAIAAARALAGACGPTWDALPSGGRTGWRCLDVGVGLGDTTAGAALGAMSGLLDDEPDVEVQGALSFVGQAPSCDRGVAVDALTPAQLDWLCRGDDLVAWLASPESRWFGERVRVRIRAPVAPDPRREAAFPGWVP